MKRLIAVLAGVLFLVSVSGCKSAKQEAPAPSAQPRPAMAPAAVALSGKVVETMNSGGYTYVLIENNGMKTWVAAPQTKVKVGQQVTCQSGMVMRNFTSKTLNRTFESIVFSESIR